MQICHKYRKHHLQYMIIEFNNILQMKRSTCVSKRKPTAAKAKGALKEPNKAITKNSNEAKQIRLL